MKVKYLSLALVLSCNLLQAQTIFINPAAAPVIDGHFSPGEWSNAGNATIEISPNVATTVWYMRDQSNFYFAFTENLGSQNILLPEILLDIDHDEAGNYQMDDWWFHVSATDCEYQGQYGNFDSCSVLRPNWTAVPNFTMGTTVDTVEIQIPFSTLGYTLQTNDTIGISFLTTNTFNLWNYWPLSADHTNPSTWGDAIVSNGIHTNEQFLGQKWEVYPVPSKGSFTLTAQGKANIQDKVHIELLNSAGIKVLNQYLKANESNEYQIDTDLPNGTYQLYVTCGNEYFSQKLLIVDAQ